MQPAPSRDARSAWKSFAFGVILLFVVVAVPVLFFPLPQPGTIPGQPFAEYSPLPSPFVPVFTDPVEKLLAVSDPAFTEQLYTEAVTYEPLLASPGTRVHMGYWSGPKNHGSLVVLLDSINSYSPAVGEGPHRAIWDEGVTSSYQFPSYMTMQNERWYERAYPVNGLVIIMGKPYADPYTVTISQTDEIWGRYSERYAMMAVPIHEETKQPVNAWCFVEGAKRNRIFYTYEYPVLQDLESKGIVTVRFAKNRDADWQQPGDWILGTANITLPAA
jgi:hypothetical protein